MIPRKSNLSTILDGLPSPEGKPTPTGLSEGTTTVLEPPLCGNGFCGCSRRCVFACPFCRQFLMEPRTISCGHTFCHNCLLQLQQKQVLSCPLCFHGTLKYIRDTNINWLLLAVLDAVRRTSTSTLKDPEINEDASTQDSDLLTVTLSAASLSSKPTTSDNHNLIDAGTLIATVKDHIEHLQLHEALQQAEILRIYHPYLCDSHYWLGVCLYRVGRLSEALHSFFGAMQLNPFNSAVEQAIQQLLQNKNPQCPVQERDEDPTHTEHEIDPFHVLNWTSPLPSSSLANSGVSGQPSSPPNSVSMHPHLMACTSLSSSSSSSTTSSTTPFLFKSISRPQSRTNSSNNVALHLSHSESSPSRCDTSHASWKSLYPYKSEDEFLNREKEPGHITDDLDNVHTRAAQPCDCIPKLLLYMSAEDFDCSLCYSTLYRPVTTPCGHTFCRPCLQRALDHRFKCPLCNSELNVHFHSGALNVCQLLEDIVIFAFPMKYAQHRDEHIADIAKFTQVDSSGASLLPVMVCTLALPGVPCPLQISGPRYRAMVRLALESGTRKFAMAIPLHRNTNTTQTESGPHISPEHLDEENSYVDIVTVLSIKSMKPTEDGRYILDTVGTRRFRVLERGTHLGFFVAKLAPFGDKPLDVEDMQPVRQLCYRVHDLADSWFRHQSGSIRQMITSHWGPLPEAQPDILGTSENGPAWHWWIISVLPVHQDIKYRLFCTQSVVHRLSSLARCLLQINDQEERSHKGNTTITNSVEAEHKSNS